MSQSLSQTGKTYNLAQRLMMPVVVAALMVPFAADADVTRASRWIDRVVLTSEGELLGRVEDFALEEDTLEVSYIVVSVGSYLIDNNLIAVTPASLTESDDGAYLVIPTDALVDAPRFADSAWPEEAQVDAGPIDPGAPGSTVGDTDTSAGTAEIVAGDRKLTVDGEGKQSITAIDRPATASGSDGVRPKTFRTGIKDSGGASPEFIRFDINKDGYLSRREIAPYFGPGLKFSNFDTDGNGGLDPFEMEVLQSRQ